MPSKLSQFWKELKRRNVVRVITVYAGAAFVILELTDIITEPLKLPSWLLPVVIVLLSIGFIIAIILSWVYDIHPEEGMVKTEPADKVKQAGKPKSSSSWKLASYISFVVIVGLIVLNIIPRTGNREILDKSIAVLPFINDSQDKDNEHLINGIMEDLLINLQSIKELRVPGRTSIEQYRNNPKPIPEIASELNVAYIVEGSGQRYGNKIRLRIQLVEGATDKHLWADSYDEEIKGPEDIFRIQSQIAESIAAELQAVISPEEKQLIEKIPTTSLTAYGFYQKGKEEHWKYRIDNVNKMALERAEDLYHDALEYDSTFALAYTGLARVYWDKHYWEDFFSEDFLDSVLILADIAISHDNQIAEAYTVRGDFYRASGRAGQALKEYDKAIELNSNSWTAYIGKSVFYTSSDNVKALENIHKAASLNRGPELPSLIRLLMTRYFDAGFLGKARYYNLEVLKLDGDSVAYYSHLTADALTQLDTTGLFEYAKKALAIDSSDFYTLQRTMWCYVLLEQYEKALIYVKITTERLNAYGIAQFPNMLRFGYVYWQNGYEKEANYYFDKQIDYCNMANDLGREKVASNYYDLACVYAFRGEKDKAYENLEIFNQKEIFSYWMVVMIKHDPMFDSIRHEPEFQQIVREVEAKYQAEHERVRQWLEENDML